MSDWRDVILHDLTPEDRADVEAKGRRIAAESRTIAQARKALALTQTQVASAMEITQGALSQMEKRDDMMVSTIQAYIEAMGGKLELIATFPGMSPFELSLGAAAGQSETKEARQHKP